VTDKRQGDNRPIVVCIHGSASTGGQWRLFRQALRGRCRVFTPDLVGYGSRRFRADGRFSMREEADAIIEQIGDITEPFHLIGHSYGGAVATWFAKQYPDRVKSLIVYEPANFNLLFREGTHTEAAREIATVAASFPAGAGGALSRWLAARKFVTYWSGADAWRGLRYSQRRWLASVAPKVAAEFQAIRDAKNVLSDVSDLEMPVIILCGTRTRQAARRVCELMAKQLRDCSFLQLVNLGHMAPVTNPDKINPLLIDYVVPAPVPTTATAARRCA